MALTKAHNRMIEGAVANVQDFGAVGDGVTNNQAAFEAAIAAANIIYIPEGLYLVDGSLDISGKKVYGDGYALSQVKLSGLGSYECIFWNKPSGTSITDWANETTWGAFSSFRIDNLRLIGSGSTAQTLPSYANWVDMAGLVWSSHASFTTIDTCVFETAQGHGISFKSCGYTNIQDCFFTVLSGNGINLHGRNVSLDAATSTNITNNAFRDVDYYGIDCFACFGILITGNQFERTDAGIRFGGTSGDNTLCRSLRIIGNYSEVATNGLVLRDTGAAATFITICHNETDNLGDDGSGGAIEDFPPVLAYDNATGGPTRGWMYRDGNVAELLGQTARLEGVRAETIDLIDAFDTSLGQLSSSGSTLQKQLSIGLLNSDSNYSFEITDQFSTNQVSFVKGNQTVTNSANAADTLLWIEKDSTTNRSINAGGTVNASGTDYAEYMEKAGDFTINKGDICGIDLNGKLTNIWNDAVSFAVKSTKPSYVGGDVWGVDADGEKLEGEALEASRQKFDRVAYCGQTPVNITGASVGDYIVPVEDNGSITGQSVTNPTLEQYMMAVGKVIAIEDDGRAKIIVKIS